MSILEAGLLLVAGGVLTLAYGFYSHSKNFQYWENKMNEQEQQLQSAISEVKTAFEGFKTRTDATIAALEEKNANTPQIDLTDEIAELKSISASMSGSVETLPAESGTTESGETESGETESGTTESGTTESGTTGEATPEGDAAPEGDAPEANA